MCHKSGFRTFARKIRQDRITDAGSAQDRRMADVRRLRDDSIVLAAYPSESGLLAFPVAVALSLPIAGMDRNVGDARAFNRSLEALHTL